MNFLECQIKSWLSHKSWRSHVRAFVVMQVTFSLVKKAPACKGQPARAGERHRGACRRPVRDSSPMTLAGKTFRALARQTASLNFRCRESCLADCRAATSRFPFCCHAKIEPLAKFMEFRKRHIDFHDGTTRGVDISPFKCDDASTGGRGLRAFRRVAQYLRKERTGGGRADPSA